MLLLRDTTGTCLKDCRILCKDEDSDNSSVVGRKHPQINNPAR